MDIRHRLVVGNNIKIGVFELANQLGWGLRLFADFKERMLSMNTIPFAFLTEIGIGANRAHETDSFDRSSITSVADDFVVDSLFLLDLLVVEVVSEHILEAGVAVVLNFLTNHSCNGGELL